MAVISVFEIVRKYFSKGAMDCTIKHEAVLATETK